MTTSPQYDLFEDPIYSELKARIEALEEKCAKDSELLRKIQKSLFGKNADIVKMLLDLLARTEQLEGKRDE